MTSEHQIGTFSVKVLMQAIFLSVNSTCQKLGHLGKENKTLQFDWLWILPAVRWWQQLKGNKKKRKKIQHKLKE